MRVLFLDVDGVLNSSRTAMTTPMGGKSFRQLTIDAIDPVAVKLINRLCKEHDLSIVFSSSHRYDYLHAKTVPYGNGMMRNSVDLFRLGIYLEQLGINHEYLIDATSDIMVPGRTRGDEITEWLSRHDVPDYVIVDDVDGSHDKPEFLDHLDNFVLVNGDEGFSYANYRECERILGESSWADKPRIIIPPK